MHYMHYKDYIHHGLAAEKTPPPLPQGGEPSGWGGGVCGSLLIYIYIYVNSLIPVPDQLFGQFEFLLSCFQRFMRTLQRAAIFYCLRWGLEPNIAFGQRSIEIYGNQLYCTPIYIPFAPPCSALCGFAEHEGWELINFR